jgi:hypothetical protein
MSFGINPVLSDLGILRLDSKASLATHAVCMAVQGVWLWLGRELINLRDGELTRVRYPPIADLLPRSSEMTRSAINGHSRPVRSA